MEQRGGPSRLTHADKTTRGSGLSGQKLWKSVLLAGKERWKKQGRPASHKSQGCVAILHPVLSNQDQAVMTGRQEAARRVKRGQEALEVGNQWKVNSL